jgi:hypothetical protein
MAAAFDGNCDLSAHDFKIENRSWAIRREGTYR